LAGADQKEKGRGCRPRPFIVTCAGLAVLLAALTLLAPDLVVALLLALGLELFAFLTEFLLVLLALLLVELAESGLAALLAGLILLALILLELVHDDILLDWKRRRHRAAARSGKITKISNFRFRRPAAQINPASGLEGSA
jgi:hypothetical protein